MNKPIIEIRGLTKRYGDRVALDHIELHVSAGEVFGVLGPNGAGKTTLLRILVGLMRQTAGSATVVGAPAGSPTSMRSVGMLVEAPAAYPYLSGRDNLRVFARYAGVDATQVDAALCDVDLVERAGDKVSTYSLGMKQRLGVATALLKEPEVLVLDEPTNGLDPAGIAEMRTLLRRLGDTGRTVVLSSHVLSEVEQTCDRLAMLADGRVVHEGTVTDLVGHRQLRIDAEPVEQASEIVARRVGADCVEICSEGLLVQAERDDAAALNRELVLAGVRVQGLGWQDRSLERVFLELTGRTGPAARTGELVGALDREVN